MLHRIISENQSGFVKGRSITENILLAQEITLNIKNKNCGGNVIIKLDMEKAYDRMSWSFIMSVLRKFGFSEEWIDIIWGLVNEVWSLNNLISCENFTPFNMNNRGPKINHLTYADDIVIFCGGNNKSIKLIKKQIRRYEKASGQKVNNDKSYFITSPNTSASRINRIRQASGFMDKKFPFNYLGCPIYHGRKNIVLFDEMLAKIVKRING
ncbi:uncharacterized protein LOC142177466 [Nicotiana tabacum]|uniref:Uncharacterized protein LOC142177466 n=1 Tax=Nicotiana tabacum TaxID=4097 RepID=A0AC58TYP8_TOBAC